MRKPKRKFFIYLFRIIGLLLVGTIISIIIALSQINLDTLRDDIAHGLSDATDLPIEINGEVSWHFSLRPRIIMSDVRVANADWAKSKDLVKIDRIYARLNLLSVFTGSPTIEALRVNGIKINLEQDGKGNNSFSAVQNAYGDDDKPENADKKKQEKHAFDFGKYGLESLNFTNMGVNIISPNKKREWGMDRFSLEYKKDGDKLQYSGYATKGGHVFPFVISMSEYDGERKVYPMKIAFANSGQPIVADVALEGTSKIPIDFVIKGTIKDPQTLAAYFEIDMPAIPTTTFNLAGGFGHSKINLRKSSIAINGNDITVSGAFNWGGAKPTITLNVKSKRIVLEDIFPDLYKSKTKWVRPKRQLNVFKDTPLYSENLNNSELELIADVKSLMVYRDLTVNDIYVKGSVKDGGFRLNANANFAGGDVRVGVRGHDEGGVLVTQSAGLANGVVVGQILDSVGVKDFLAEMPVNFEYYLEGAGQNLEELVSSAWGPVKVYSVGKGYAYSELVSYLYGQDFLTSLRHSITDIFRSQDKYDQMAVNCAAINLKVRNGRAETENGVAVGTNAINIRASGYIDFGAEKMKVALATVPVRGIKLSISGSVVNSMEVSGSLAEPEIKVSGTALAAKAVKATGIGILLAPLTGGLSAVAGAGIAFFASDLLENWLADSMPCQTAREEGAPVKEGDPEFLDMPIDFLAEGII